MRVTFIGFNTHPGYAKGQMVNAIKAAARFVDRLPPDRLSPETTDGYEGYVHPYQMEASVDRTSVRVLLRDFVTSGLREKQQLVERIATEVAAATGTRVEFEVDEQYRNMREVLDRHPGRRRARAGGDPPRGPDADRKADSRRHRRLPAVVHGPADAEPLRRRAQLPFAPRVDLAPGPRTRGRGHRRNRPRRRPSGPE